MTIWSSEIKDLEILNVSVVGKLPLLEKELEQLINTQDANVVMLYSRRCLEVIVTDLCEYELKRPRKTEPLKGIIDKLNSEEKVPSHIITSMLGLNSLSTYGAHPKDFDPEQVKPALSNLSVIIKWYINYCEKRNDNGPINFSSASELSKERSCASFECSLLPYVMPTRPVARKTFTFLQFTMLFNSIYHAVIPHSCLLTPKLSQETHLQMSDYTRLLKP